MRITKHNNKTTRRKTVKTSRQQPFIQDFITSSLETLNMIKLYHWKTHDYATHKATDELYELLNTHIDNFVEVLMGKMGGMRADLTKVNHIALIDLNNKKMLVKKVDSFKLKLSKMEKTTFIKSTPNTELLNIRDEILADLNKFLYLLTLD